MSSRQDLLVRLDTEFGDKGFKSAEASAKTLEREMNKLEAQERQLANLQMQAAREAEARRAAQVANMEKVGRSAALMGAAIAVGLGIAGKAAMDWESAWTGVTKTVNGNADQMGALEEQLRGLARTLPATHEEIAGVAEAAGQLGVRRQDIAGFTKTMIDLGVSTNLTADEAATGIAQISNVMGTMSREGVAGVQRFGATLVALGNAGASTEAEILSMAQRLAGAGKLIGASESDVLALSNAMASMGIEAELGGGAMSRTMTKIYAAVKEGGDSLEGFAKVAGMTAQQFADQWQSDPMRAVDAFIQGLNRIDGAGGNVIGALKELGIKGTQDLQVLLRLKGAGDLLSDSLDLGNQAWKENLALLNEANKRYETSASRVQIARNELNDVAIDIGAVVLPAFVAAADRVGALANAFRELPGWAKTSVTVLGSVASAALILGGAALMLVPKLAAMNAALEGMGGRGAAAAKGLRSAGSALAGPWGVALAAATVLLGVWAEKQYEAKAAQDQLAASLDQQTGAVTANTKAIAAKKLQDEGLLDMAKGLGVSLSDLADAAIGNGDAMGRLADASAKAKAEYEAMTAAAREGKDVDYDALVAAEGKATAYARLMDATGAQRKELEPLIEKTKQQAEAMGKDADATNKSAAASGTWQDAVAGMGGTAEDATKAIDELIKSVEEFGASTLDAHAAERAYQAAVDDATKALEKNGVSVNKAHTAFNRNTEAGRANEAALEDIAKSALKSATANFENGKSVASVTKQVMTARGQFVDMATKMGLSKTAANKLADQLGLTKTNVNRLGDAVQTLPSGKTITVKVLGIEKASANVSILKQQIRDLNGKTVTITQRLVTQDYTKSGGRVTAGGLTKADGGVVDYFAGGGLWENHRAQIAPAGSWRVWAEPETGGEGYIPLHPSKRDQSIPVWMEVGRRLGVLEGGGGRGGAGGGSVAGSRSFTVQVNADPGVAREYASVAARKAATALQDAIATYGLD